MIRQYSKLPVKVGSIIMFDDCLTVKYKVNMCIDLKILGHNGYQLNLVRQ